MILADADLFGLFLILVLGAIAVIVHIQIGKRWPHLVKAKPKPKSIEKTPEERAAEIAAAPGWVLVRMAMGGCIGYLVFYLAGC